MSEQRYRKLNTFFRSVFGEKVYRVGLYGGFSCPNRNGEKGSGGCTFCNPATSAPLGYEAGMTIRQQLDWGTGYIRRRHGAEKFIAYFLDYTATYDKAPALADLYAQAIDYPGVVGLALGTRPDCLDEDVLDVLSETAKKTFLWVELGVQSASQTSLDAMNRCHSVEDSSRAIAHLLQRNIAVSAHVILGIPGESTDDMLATADFVAKNGVHGVKIHNLHITENTRMAHLYRQGRIRVLELDQYVELVISFIEHLPANIIIQRISGEAPRRLTVAPAWSVNKLAVVNAVQRRMTEIDSWQGKALGCSRDDIYPPVVVPGAGTR